MRGRTTEGLIDERNRPTTNPTRTQHNHPTTIFWPRKPSKPRWREGRRTQQQQSPRTNRPFTETSFLPMKHYTHQLRFDSIRFDLIPRRIILDSTVYDFVIGIAYHRNRVEEGPAAGEVFPPLRRGLNSNVPVWNDIIHPIRRRRKHTVPVFPIAVGHDSVPFPSNLFLFPRPYFSGIRI